MEKITYFLNPSGFCLGVKGAIKKLKEIIEENPGEKIFCVHEIVHNPSVVNYFVERGVVFVNYLEEIKDNNVIVVFSAHGVNREVLEKSMTKYVKVYNLECPLVTKVYNELERFVDREVLFYVGKKGHVEATGITDYAKYLGKKVYIFDEVKDIPKIGKNEKIGILSQTTQNWEEVEKIFEKIKKSYKNIKFSQSNDICKATFERQLVIKNNKDKFDSIIVIGGKTSSNTKELCKIGENLGKKVFFGENLNDILEYGEELLDSGKIAVTGGASTPFEDIEKVLNWFIEKGYVKENILLNS